MRKAVTMRRGEPKYLPDPDEPTDAERALAVLDRLVRDPHTYTVQTHMTLHDDVIHVIAWQRDGSESPRGVGMTVEAALLALGARLEGDDGT